MSNNNRIALITGANRGIGLAIARSLVTLGFQVLAAARHQDDADTVAREIGATGVQLDLRDPGKVDKRARMLESRYGPVDVLVNNAGVLFEGDGLTVDLCDIEQSLNVNAISPLVLIRGFGAKMRARGYGRIVNISSGWGSFGEGLGGPAAYSISKATLNAITLSLAQSLGPQVKINAACPGWVHTRMGGASATRTPEEGADTPVWLATLPDDGPTGGLFRDRRPVSW